MKVIIRRADLEKDRPTLVRLFHEFLTPHSDERRFDWLYLQNPCGLASAWIAVNRQNDQPVGAAAAFPRRIRAERKERKGFVLGDFCVDPGYRSLGPALQLQRACFEELADMPDAVCFDFPSTGMLAVYRRLGVQPQDRLVRMAKPLRADRTLSGKLRAGRVAGSLAALANAALAVRDSLRNVDSSVEMAWHEGPCGEEFSSLAEQAWGGDKIGVLPTAEYLNWRYLSHPIARFDVLTARRKGDLVGYLILQGEGHDARIVTLLGREEKNLLRTLVLRSIETLRKEGVMTVSAPVLASHPFVNLFRSIGFLPRESSPVVFYPSLSSSSGSGSGTQFHWFLMDGDRDS